MPVIIDEKQLERLERTKRKSRRGKAVKPSPKEERELRRRMTDLWLRVLRPTAEKVKQMVRDKASASMIADVIELALERAEFEFGIQADDIVSKWKMGVDVESRRALQKGLTKSLAVGVSAVVDSPAIAETLSVGGMEAAGLIKSIPAQYLGDVTRAVADNYAGRPLPEGRSLLQELTRLGAKSKKRAIVIARDQTSKLTSLVNQTRQQSIGVDSYIWRTMKDRRVVGKPSGLYPEGNKAHGNHYMMEGMYCRWDDATVYSDDKGKTWKKRKADMPKAAPGWEILCRCYSEPVINVDKILQHSQRL